MLTKTSLNAIRSLLYIARADASDPIRIADIATQLDTSSSYLSKIHTLLVKARLLEAHRGVKGGVSLARPAASITLLDIVEACQGKVLGDYCTPHEQLEQVCAFHEAMHQLQEAIIGALTAWTLQDLVDRPLPIEALRDQVACRMGCVCEASPPEDNVFHHGTP